MNSAERRALKSAEQIVKKSENKYDMNHPFIIEPQPWTRNVEDNPDLDKFVRSPSSFTFNARVKTTTYTNKNGRYVPSLLFDRLVYKGIVRSTNIICYYSPNLAKLNEVWPGDWLKFNASVSKSMVPYSPYLYKLNCITNSQFFYKAPRKSIYCYVDRKTNQIYQKLSKNKHYHKLVEYLIYSNRDLVPQDEKTRAGYAISKATPSYVQHRNKMLSFSKKINGHKKAEYVSKYSGWKLKHQDHQNHKK